MKRPSTRRMAGWNAPRCVIVGSESGVGRITHEGQILQAREVAEGPSRDARESVVILLKDGEELGS